MDNAIVSSFIEVTINKDDFGKIIETLGRIGIASKAKKQLFQTCHILHKRGKYYIVHFKELFMLDGKQSSLTVEDIARRNHIISLLESWELVEVIEGDAFDELPTTSKGVSILKHSEKPDWELITKYKIGKYKGTKE